MADILQRLKQHKLVQWAVAYAAAAWVVLQVLDLIFGSYSWPKSAMHIALGVLAVGFVVVLVLAWYHGERGVQRVSGTELLIIALILAVGGGVLWNFSRTKSKVHAVPAMASAHASHPAGQSAAASAAGKTIAGSARAVSTARRTASSIMAQPIPAKSVAVLPFENLSADKNNVYFADGIQDLILTKLADIGDLKVIARTSTESYGSHPQNLTKVGQQLGVATILEGSVQKAGKQVLINVQLIDAKSDSHVWAHSYTRTLENIFGVEGEVAEKVAKALNAELTATQTSAVAAVPTHNPQAFDAYLRGEGYISRAEAGKFQTALPKAVAAYRQAVDQDPQFALAWAKLALAQGLLNYASVDTSTATSQQALANARHALALAPNLPQAHFALGYVYRFDFADYDKALAQFKIARNGLPNSADVEAAIGYIEEMRGDTQAAAAAFERASASDPRNPNLALSLGQALMTLRRFHRAGDAFRRVLAVASDDPEAYTYLAALQLRAHGDADAALAELAKAPAALQNDPEIVSSRVGILLLQRKLAAARRVVVALKPGGRFVTPTRVALLHAKVSRLSGDAEAARTSYAKALSLAKAAVARGGEAGLGANVAVAMAQAGLGHKDAALHAISHLRTAVKQRRGVVVIPVPRLATMYVLLGDNERAIAVLAKASAGPVPSAAYARLLLRDPTWDPIRHDPRFQALLKKYAKREPAR